MHCSISTQQGGLLLQELHSLFIVAIRTELQEETSEPATRQSLRRIPVVCKEINGSTKPVAFYRLFFVYLLDCGEIQRLLM